MKTNHANSLLVLPLQANRLLFVLLLLIIAPFAAAQSSAPTPPPATATNSAAKGPAKAYPLTICLVTDSDLDSMGDEVAIVYQGQVLKFCCKPCVKKFLRAPEKYLAKLAAAETGKK